MNQRPSTDHQSAEERHARGRERRKAVPRSSLGEWAAGPDRRDPVALIEEQNADRLPWLVPVRHGRMGVSAFTFYRGAARIMATDLATTPTTGLMVQACGDAHLSNFGAYASPERRLVFDLNDFDETRTGPWEWDVKRMAASFTICGRDRGFTAAQCRSVARRSAESYRDAMAEFAAMRTLDVWYAHATVDRITEAVSGKAVKRLGKFQRKAKSKDSLQALSKLGEKVDGRLRIRSDPPVLVPLRDLPIEDDPEELESDARLGFASYRESLADNRRRLLDRFEVIDVGLKVVGVGSVGTRCLIVLLLGRDGDDPLFLQIKEATNSVLDEHLPPSRYENQGERVVRGQRLMQATSDVLLGWSAPDRRGPHFYWRQLKDWKGSANLDKATPKRLEGYASLCGWTLARAHARSGDPVAIAAYLGSGDVALDAIADFSEAYADQNEGDYRAFTEAIASGRIEATTAE